MQFELQPEQQQLEPDHVLAELLRQMHLSVGDALAPFEPESGGLCLRRTWPCAWPRTRALMTDTSPTALLELMQLASPALPMGGFTYSEGLEAAVEAGLMRDEGQAGDWVQQTRESAEARQQTQQMSRSLAEWLKNRHEPEAQRQAFTPMLAILSAQHETQYSRLFRY